MICECGVVDINHLDPETIWGKDIRSWEVVMKLAARRKGKL